MKQDDRIDPERREFIQRATGALAAGLVLPVVACTSAGVSETRVGDLAAIKGSVVSRGAPNYEVWRKSMIWNYRKFDRHPDIIVQAEDEHDVVETINFARGNGLKIKTRSGGHCWSGSYLRDGGILLDLSRFQSVEIDKQTRTAIVGPGVLSRGLAYRLGERGLAFPVAHSGMVPISGFLLGGGLGWNANAWGGMSVFNIKALDVVTADGQIRHVSSDSNEDLYWAALGGGPGLFFTVIRFFLQCYDLPTAITSDTYILPNELLVPSVELMDELGPELSRAVELLSVVIPAGNTCAVDDCERVVLLNAKAFAQSDEEANKMLAPLREHPLFKEAMNSEIGKTADFEHLFQEEEVGFPQRRGRADNILTDRAAEAAPVLHKHMPSAPSPFNTPLILYLGETAFPDVAYSAKGRFYMSAYAQWDDAGNDAGNIAWITNMYDDMQPFATNHYINEFDRESRADQVHKCYSPEAWKRLRKLRLEFDPDNVFHDFLGGEGV